MDLQELSSVPFLILRRFGVATAPDGSAVYGSSRYVVSSSVL